MEIKYYCYHCGFQFLNFKPNEIIVYCPVCSRMVNPIKGAKMNKVAKNKKFWVGELNIQFGDKQVNSFVFIDCKTNEEAELKLKEYASTFWSDLDEGEEPADEGSYSFDNGNVIMFANLIDEQMTLNDYATKYMLEI